MDILAARRSIEQRLLKQSVALMSLVAVSGTIMGVITGSSAVLLDGIFSFIDVIIKIMMLMTAKLVARETSKRFQFGYWQFEPLVLVVEGFFILLIVLYALISGIGDLLNGGRHVDFGIAIYYAVFFTIADTASGKSMLNNSQNNLHIFPQKAPFPLKSTNPVDFFFSRRYNRLKKVYTCCTVLRRQP